MGLEAFNCQIGEKKLNSTVKKINENKIIAIFRGVDLEKVIPAARALLRGGIKLMEITFDQTSLTCEEDTCSAIRKLSDLSDELCIGAGTVMTEQQVEAAVAAGAKYIISPNTNIDVIKKTIEMNAVSIPGALTPSEASAAYEAGAHFIKMFPAGSLGLDYIKAVRAPLKHIPMLAVGGVNEHNIGDFFKTGLCGVGIGSNIVDLNLINNGKFEELELLAKKYTSQI